MKTDLPLGAVVIPLGKALLGPLTVPSTATKFSLMLDSTQHVHPFVFLDLAIDLSLDDEKSWQHMTSSGRFGGTNIFDDDGKPVTSFTIAMTLPAQVGQTERKIRVKIDAKDGSFSTAGGVITVE